MVNSIPAKDEAIELYESLPEHDVDYETAFDAVVEEAAQGRPLMLGEPLKQTAIWLTEGQIEWLKGQGGTMSEAMRNLIDAAMQ